MAYGLEVSHGIFNIVDANGYDALFFIYKRRNTKSQIPVVQLHSLFQVVAVGHLVNGFDLSVLIDSNSQKCIAAFYFAVVYIYQFEILGRKSVVVAQVIVGDYDDISFFDVSSVMSLTMSRKSYTGYLLCQVAVGSYIVIFLNIYKSSAQTGCNALKSRSSLTVIIHLNIIPFTYLFLSIYSCTLSPSVGSST